jgi:hypothetical protein
VLDKQASDEGTDDSAYGPGSQHDREIFGPLAKGDDVGEDNLTQSDDATAADALNSTAGKHDRKGFGDGRTEKGAEGEGRDGENQQLLAAEDVGQGGDEGLAHGTRKEVGGACPERVRCRAA